MHSSYTVLPERFYIRQHPLPVKNPVLLVFNQSLAEKLGLNWGEKPEQESAALLAGNTLPEGADPVAMAYAGHQFGNFVPQLGDGRALLLGEANGYDVQLKGSGRTPFSRQGDGRATLASVLRECLISEAMHALGIPTTRSLAVVSTGEMVQRETPRPGGILTRVASSHIRIGTFQYCAARGDWEGVRLLYAYTRQRHYPDVETPGDFLKQVIIRQASLVAQWLCVGFIHGVMNTDNASIAGETIDYGPCAFMDSYDPQTVFSAIDWQGRYAYAAQPTAAQWNLARLAECLLPLLDKNEDRALEKAREALATFVPVFEAEWQAGMRRKLGLASEHPGDRALIGSFLQEMQASGADFTNTFRQLYHALVSPEDTPCPLSPDWQNRWQQRLAQESTPPPNRLTAMRHANPAFIPRNHRVEQVLAAAENGNFTPFDTLHRILSAPFDEQPEYAAYASPPEPAERVYQTFCGT